MQDETTPTQDERNQAKINTTKCPKTTPNKNGINDNQRKTKIKSKTKMQTVPKQEQSPMTNCEG